MLGRDAHWIASLGHHMGGLQLYDRKQLAAPTPVALPADTSISAWVGSDDGVTLALGDTKGRVFLLDIATQKLRQLPMPLGREVSWLAFSEDDAWLAAVRIGGQVFAFDVASGEPLNSDPIHLDFLLRQVTISHRERVLVASGTGDAGGPGKTVVWRLSTQGLNAQGATLLVSAPTPRTAGQGFNGVGTSLQTGLLATAAIDGEVRLWRLPHSPILPARAAAQIPGMLYFDGSHIVDVEYSKLRIVSRGGVGLTPWVELPQPVGFAVLVDAGRTLLATCGTELRVFDGKTLSLRYPPVQLANTPMHLVADEHGDNLVLGFGGTGATGFEVRVQTYDLKTGRRRAEEAVINGPLRQLELSPDGSRLLATGPVNGATEVFDATTLRLLGSYRHDRDAPVVWASFASGSGPERGQLLIAAARRQDAQSGVANSVVQWDPLAGTVGERRLLHENVPVGIIAASGKPFVAGKNADVFDPGAMDENISPSGSTGVFEDSTAALATSHDGRLIAHAFQRYVQLYDVATAAPVGPPLPSGVSSTDHIAQLAFDADDHQLLGRTLQGYWLVWPIAADNRPLAEIRGDAALLTAHPVGSHVLQLSGAGEREQLRRHDPGAPPVPQARPTTPSVRDVTGAPIPMRDPSTSPLMLDLTEVYTLAPESIVSQLFHMTSMMRGSPLGAIRLDGIDYDVRGLVELTWRGHGQDANPDSAPIRATGICVPQIPIAAFHLLLNAVQNTPQPDEVIYANVRLHYTDRSSAILPIRAQREVPGGTDADRPTPFAWAIGDSRRLVGDLYQGMISSPRLLNPHPERLIETLDLEPSYDTFSQPVFFAVTAEPVIASTDLGTRSREGEAKSK